MKEATRVMILRYLAYAYFQVAWMLGFRTTLLIERKPGNTPPEEPIPPGPKGNVLAFKKKPKQKNRRWL